MKLNRTPNELDRNAKNGKNDNWEKIEGNIKRIDGTISDLILESGGDSNLEVVQARGGKPVLNDRLNNIDTQLAETEQQITNLENNKMNVSVGATKQELNQKEIEIKSYLNDQLTQIGTMSPKGAYPTLQDLENAYPSGTDGVYIVQADGHWYYWSGNNWADGGLYQATPWNEFMTEANEWWAV